MSTTGYTLGVDLGTTWTAAAIRRGACTEVLPLGSNTAAMPSVVALDGNDVIAGERAERQVLADPSSGIREAKRRLGDTAPMVMAGQPYGAEALMGHLLRHVVAVATARTGAGPDAVVLTHPATWGDYKLDLFREAGRLAGVGAVTLVPEPVAAAMHYASLGRLAPGDIVAVYDFGGGTFDAAVVQCNERGAEILGPPEGLERLGGVDLDQMVVVHVDRALDGKLRELDSTDPEVRRALVQLRADCTLAKEALSTDTEASISITAPGLHTQVRITRDEFEAAARARIADTLGALDRAVAGASVEMSALAGVLLVGGSSRIPVVSEEVGRHSGRPTLLDADLKLVVALGAVGGSAVMATTKNTDSVDTNDTEAANAAPSASKVPTTAAAQAAAKASALRAAASTKDPKKEKEGGSINTGLAAGLGVAAAGAAAAGYVATQVLGDDGDDDAAAAVATDVPPAPADDSMDAFDDLGGGGGGGGGGRGGGRGGRGRGGSDDDGPGAPASGAGAPAMPAIADISAARAELLERFAQWEPPEGADPAAVAEFRAEVEGLINRYQPVPGQSANDALATLRQQFDDQVEDFVQDIKLDAVIEDHDQPQADPDSGFTWVPGHMDANGEYIDGHWERARADADPAPVDEPDDVWVDGYYDANGNYVKGHYEDAPAVPAPPDPPDAPDAPPPADPPPYTRPEVRDHRGEDDNDAPGGIRVTPSRGERGGEVRDHRRSAADDDADPSPFGQLRDAFDDLLPSSAAVPRMAPAPDTGDDAPPATREAPEAPEAPPARGAAGRERGDDRARRPPRCRGIRRRERGGTGTDPRRRDPRGRTDRRPGRRHAARPRGRRARRARSGTARRRGRPDRFGPRHGARSVADTPDDFADPDPVPAAPETPSDLDNDPHTPL